MKEDYPLFIADVHLGKLAKGLRMAGFDVLYQNNYTNEELKTIAAAQNRILLSRNPAFGKDTKLKAFILESEDWLVQMRNVIAQFELKESFRPFTRCIVCNGTLQPVSKEKVESQLEENTRNYFDAYWQCAECKRIYWKGSHYDRMESLIRKLKGGNENDQTKF